MTDTIHAVVGGFRYVVAREIGSPLITVTAFGRLRSAKESPESLHRYRLPSVVKLREQAARFLRMEVSPNGSYAGLELVEITADDGDRRGRATFRLL